MTDNTLRPGTRFVAMLAGAGIMLGACMGGGSTGGGGGYTPRPVTFNPDRLTGGEAWVGCCLWFAGSPTAETPTSGSLRDKQYSYGTLPDSIRGQPSGLGLSNISPYYEPGFLIPYSLFTFKEEPAPTGNYGNLSSVARSLGMRAYQGKLPPVPSLTRQVGNPPTATLIPVRKEFDVPSGHIWRNYDELNAIAYRVVLEHSQFLVQGLHAHRTILPNMWEISSASGMISTGVPTSPTTWDDTLTGRWSGVAVGMKALNFSGSGLTFENPIFSSSEHRDVRAEVDVNLRLAAGVQRVDMKFHNWKEAGTIRPVDTSGSLANAANWETVGLSGEINVRNLDVDIVDDTPVDWGLAAHRRVEINKGSTSSATISHSSPDPDSNLAPRGWDIEGLFYGPNAQETGGTFDFTFPFGVPVAGEEGTVTHRVRGAWGAKKQ